jgi:hypothetical protein
MKSNLRRSFLVARMNMQSSSTGITMTTTATTKDASQELGLFGTHECKLTASKSQVLKQVQISEGKEFNLVISCKNGDVQLTLLALESDKVWIVNTGATSHVTKHKI